MLFWFVGVVIHHFPETLAKDGTPRFLLKEVPDVVEPIENL